MKNAVEPKVLALIQDKVRFSSTQRWFLYLSLLLLAITGVAWLVVDFSVSQELLDYHALRWQAWVLKLHGGAAYLALIGFGSVLARHVARGWFLRRNRISGVTLISLMVVLALSGYMLYYIAGEESREWTSLVHWLCGALGCLAFPLHLWSRTKARSAAARGPAQRTATELSVSG